MAGVLIGTRLFCPAIFLIFTQNSGMSKSVFDLHEQNSKLTGKIVVGLEKLSEAFRVLLWDQAKKYGLSPIQIQLLVFIDSHAEAYATVSYLANEFNMTKPTISDAVKVLEKKGLIQKVKNPLDTRSFNLQLTKEGKLKTTEVATYANRLTQIVDRLGDDKKSDLWGSLSQLINDLRLSGIITVQRTCYNCSQYSKNEHGHFCSLLGTQLEEADIRIDCPDHKAS